MKIDDAVAVVTGGASGLGLATVHALLGRAARVVIVDLPNSEGEMIAEKLGERVRFAPADVADAEAVASALDVAESLGALRIVVNSAGVGDFIPILGESGPYPIENFIRVLGINLVGTFNVLRLAAERIAAHQPSGGDRGVIVNTASVAAFDGQIGQAAYAASKGGVVAMTLPIARELARQQIRVVTIAPGLFETPIMALLPDEAKKAFGAQVPHPSRMGNPDEFAALVVHIVENSMLNGEVIRLDGAARMPPELILG
ncbi:SDR family NAD(P)-dependent oxidoreductase [Mycolicibacterium moriokaense]|nr:SDR family NAD(P)-dependent oxidoreductase [Mycolicibacterium moriokaense]